jgi:succinyl-CoA synthetase alpha subunit
MSILLNETNRIIVQGITGREGKFHTEQMLHYGTKIVGGMTPKRGGETILGVPIFNTMNEAVKATDADTSIIYVPAAGAGDAIMEAAAAGIKLIVCITEGVPTLDVLKAAQFVNRVGARLIGPNCPGLISPGKSKLGIMPGHIHRPGSVGLVSRSGTLTYEVVQGLSDLGLGQSTVIGIGGDPVVGTSFVDVLELFQRDSGTKSIVLIGEIGGSGEDQAAAFIKENVTKPVVAFIAGTTAPEGKRMGHAGAIVAGGSGSAKDKVAALQAAGVQVADSPTKVARMMFELVS